MKVEVLVATMHQTDRELPKRLNLQTDAVVINQCDTNGYEELEYRGHRVIWVNTCQRGLSKSRNMALSYATGDICLFADEDIVYLDGYEPILQKAFSEQPCADIIAFNAEYVNYEGLSKPYSIERRRKAPRNKYYGSIRLAVRRGKLVKTGISFHTLIGAGTKYGSGEESLFLRNCRKSGLQIYENPDCLSVVEHGQSSWFAGYNETYYRNKGVFLALAYGKLAKVYGLYFVLQGRRISSLSPKAIYRHILAGIKEYYEI